MTHAQQTLRPGEVALRPSCLRCHLLGRCGLLCGARRSRAGLLLHSALGPALVLSSLAAAASFVAAIAR